MLVTFGICFKQHFDTRYLVFYNTSPPRMFLSLDLLWEYRMSVCPSVCPSLCEYVSSSITLVLYHMIRCTYCLSLPNFQGHMVNFKVTQAKKNLVKRVKLRVFGHFLENAWGKGLKYRMLMYPDHLIKSPRYTGGDFIFLYRFVGRRRRRPQILVHAITFEQLLRFFFIFRRLLALTYRLPD